MRKRRMLVAMVAGGGLLALHTAWIAGRWGGDQSTTFFSDLIGVPPPLAASIASAVAGIRSRGRRRRGWLLFAAGMFSWTVGAASWAWYEVVLRVEAPFPGLPDIGFLGMIPLAAAGMLTFVEAPSGARSRVRMLLDGMIVGTSLLFVSWAFVLGPYYRANAGSVMELALGLAFPIGDLFIVSIVAFVVARLPRKQRSAVALVTAGLVAIALADSAFVALSISGEFASGGWIDVAWNVGCVLIVLGAVRAWDRAPEAPAPAEHRLTGWLHQLPYAAVVLALGSAIAVEVTHGEVGPFLFWTLLGVVVCVTARQSMSLLENLLLNRTLEAKVRERTAQLRRTDERFRSLVQNASDIITILNEHGEVRYTSPAIERILGYQPHEIEQSSLLDLVHPEDRDRAAACLKNARVAVGITLNASCRMRHADGEWRHVETAVKNLLADETISGIVVNTRDVTERTHLEHQLAHRTFHDPLTGLANRALFQNRLEHALAARDDGRNHIGVLFLDLDRFKAINDTLGHAFGDRLLDAVAERLTSQVRSGDTVARLGGDEFGIMVERGGDVAATAERVLSALREPFVIDGRELIAPASIGIAESDSQHDADDLLRNADVAMYAAKAHGGGHYAVYESTMHEALVERIELENELRHAIARDEFRLLYQPIVDMDTGLTTGVEALIRWRHPRLGWVEPQRFIPLAEANGLIVPIGRWVLHRACRDLQRMQARAGRQLRMSVNLSAVQFGDDALINDVARALAEYDVDPGSLTLEITESVLMRDAHRTTGMLKRLKQLGVRLAIDDFGTGYSSLSYLRRFPVDVVKIDRAFVAEVNESAQDAALIRAIVKLSGAFGYETVAEGVETWGQADRLRDLGCRLAQGYVYAKPCEADTLFESHDEATAFAGASH